MKKISAFALAVLMLFTFAACNSDPAPTEPEAEWKQFLKDYEAWVDDYVEIFEKYKKNPADLSILYDYLDMVSEMVEWEERADEIELELEDTSAALEYSKEILRITGKMAKIMD